MRSWQYSMPRTTAPMPRHKPSCGSEPDGVHFQKMARLAASAVLDCVDQCIECTVERYGAAVQSARAHARGTARQQRDCGHLAPFTGAQQCGQHEVHRSVAAVDAEQFDSVFEQRVDSCRKVGERGGFNVAHVAQTFELRSQAGQVTPIAVRMGIREDGGPQRHSARS